MQSNSPHAPLDESFQILIANEQATLSIDETRLITAVRSVLEASDFSTAFISIAVVDDPKIHEINRQFLEHDYPTDVISFVLEETETRLEGELVISADTAISNSQEYGWPAENELLLYAVHGCLHLIGYRDHHPEEKAEMLSAEAEHLQKLGISIPTNQSRWNGNPNTSEEEVK